MSNYFIWRRLRCVVLGILISTTFGLQNPETAKAQEIQADKCDLIEKKYADSYRKCFGKDFLDSVSPFLVDSFGITSLEDEWAKLDVFFTLINNQLSVDKKAIGYVVVYGGRTNKYGELLERPKTLKAYIKTRGYDPSKIIFVQGGFREKFTYEFWISRSDKMYPPITPTVETEKVVFRGKMKPLPTELGN